MSYLFIQEHDQNNRKFRDNSNSVSENGKQVKSQTSPGASSQNTRASAPFQKNLSHEKLQPLHGRYASKNRYNTKNALSADKWGGSVSSSIEKLHDSLEDPAAIDSGLGSSCEYKTKVMNLKLFQFRDRILMGF